MMRAAIYVRSNATEHTLDSQLAKLRDLAEQREFSVVGEYIDKCICSEKNRPGLSQLLRDAKKAKFDSLLLDGFNRLAWSASYLKEFVEDMMRLGVRIVSLRDSFDSGSMLTNQSALTVPTIESLNARLRSERFPKWSALKDKSDKSLAVRCLSTVEFSEALDDIEAYYPF